MTINTSTTTGPDLVALKSVQHQTWSSGDYGSVAWITVPLPDELVAAVDLAPGTGQLGAGRRRGTGHVAIATARAFCPTTGIDYVSGLVDTAARWADAEGLHIAFEVGDAAALPTTMIASTAFCPRSAPCSPRTTRRPPMRWCAHTAASTRG